jgi:hypothetical protein
MRTSYFIITIAIFALAGTMSTGCKKGNLTGNGTLTFSADTLVFDTVFTTIGSVTKNFKFYNNDNKPLTVSKIKLMGGDNSPYRINVDGLSGNEFNDVNIEGNDSLYIFVEVTLDPNNQLNPIVIEDSIQFTTNGFVQYVQLASWGQDMYFHYKDLNEGVWPNDKPHVIYGYAAVDSSKTLNIQAGTDIYLHKSAILYVYKGALNINGTTSNPVTLQGDRLEMAYDDVSGQYYGIYFQEALPSIIDHTIIKNGTSGIHLFSEDPANTGYTLTLTNTEIYNCARYGVFIYSGAKVKAENCLIYKNLNHSLLVLEGGDFNFNHCHLVGYNSSGGQVPSVGLSNTYYDPTTGTTFIGSIEEGVITNSVIYGNLDQELAFDTIGDPAITLSFQFENNHIRSQNILTAPFFANNTWNQSPLFKDVTENDFTFWSTSPLRDAGNNLFFSPTDILGSSRVNVPDIGAYELY